MIAAGCGANARQDELRPAADQGQAVTLGWSENCGTNASPLLITTRRVVAGPNRWTVDLSVTNRTGVPLTIERPHVSGGAEFGLSFYRTAARSEIEARARAGAAKPQLYADTYDPRLPPALLDGERWNGSFSGRGRIRRSGPIRIVLGRFVVRGRAPRGFPERFLCISERVLRLG